MNYKWLLVTIVVVLIGCFIFSFFSNEDESNEPEAVGWEKERSRSVSDYISIGNASALMIPTDFCSETSILLQIFVITAPERILARQIIRSTWGNIDNFNYDKFKVLHQKAKDTYLEINFKDWKHYIYNENALTDNGSPTEAKFRIKLTFLMGKTSNSNLNAIIEGESRQFNDILMEDFVDHYANMTLKSVSMLKWGTNICEENAKFIAKVDDDEIVILPNLIHILLGGTLPLYYDLIFYYNYRTINALDERNRLPSRNLLAGHAYQFSSVNRNPKHK